MSLVSPHSPAGNEVALPGGASYASAENVGYGLNEEYRGAVLGDRYPVSILNHIKWRKLQGTVPKNALCFCAYCTACN
jgi:hypothetical protein